MRDSGNHNSRFADMLKKIGHSLLKLFGGDFPVFLLFLIISFFFWWSQTMSQDYDTVLKLPVQIVGIPDDIRVVNSSSGQISVSLNGKGTALRKSVRRGGKHVIHVDNDRFNMSQGHAAFSTQWLRDSIQTLLPASVSIRSIEPDSLVYQFVHQHSVMLPVKFEGTIVSQDQFFMERIEFQPDSIMVKIPLTDTLIHRVVADVDNVIVQSDTTVSVVALKPVPDAFFSVDKVTMTVISQQYTEKSLEVPVSGVNFPDFVSLKSFPSKAVVTAWVKMSEYDKVSSHDFQVVVDFNDIAGRDVSKAPLRIFSQPANVRNVRLQTRSVDFLMESRYY